MSERDNQLLGPMAAFIGARLQYPNPHINGQGNPWVSTILVEQHKEKCWYIRVYCKLAHESLVRKKWQWLKDNKDTFKGPSRFMPNIDVSAAEPTREFYARCVKRDAMHYREVYRDMVNLQPHLKAKVCSQADYAELLYDTYPEVESRVLELAVNDKAGVNWVAQLCERYHVKDINELKVFMKTVYEPSAKDFLATIG